MVQYIIYSLFLRLFLFFKHWYFDSWNFMHRKTLKSFRFIDKKLSVRINLFFLFKPLYQERNFTGYVLGFLFRGTHIIIGMVFYIAIFVFWILLYVLWAIIPIFILYKAFSFLF